MGHHEQRGEEHGHQHQHEHESSRRDVLRMGGVAAAALLVPTPVWMPFPATAATNSRFAGLTARRLAMHVHGSWSEGSASWEAQFALAVAHGIDVLYMTDHDGRAVAFNYLTSLSGVTWVRSTAGALRQQASTSNGGSFRVLAESSSSSAPATVKMEVQPQPMAHNRLRTAIAGQVIEHTVGTARIDGGARYEVAVPLSIHPAAGGRPAGHYLLVYRFGSTSTGRHTENGGLTGVIDRPAPGAGSVQRLSPEIDVAALWPTMFAKDNVMFGVSFTARSPRRGVVADVAVSGVRFLRSQTAPTTVSANQANLVSSYQPRFPNLLVRRGTEVSRTLPDLNPFGIPQYFPDYASLPTNNDALKAKVVSNVHAQNGLVSWNHPFGYSAGPLLNSAERVAKRRQVFSSMMAVGQYGVDILEVGYTLRGNVDAPAHLALWDTFSRNGTFLTGNGTTDDHSGVDWQVDNGFLTGVWTATRTDADILGALAAGRAYVAHMRDWPGGAIDLLVDGTVPMGSVSVAAKTVRSMAISAKNLPSGSSVRLVSGRVDYAANVDPGTTVVRTLTPAGFSGGVAIVSVDTSTSRFFRAEVRSSTGAVIGSSNPVWLLRQQPPQGIPAPRRP